VEGDADVSGEFVLCTKLTNMTKSGALVPASGATRGHPGKFQVPFSLTDP